MGRFNLIIAIVAMFICNTVAFAANHSNAALAGKSSTSSIEAVTTTESALNMEAIDAATLLPVAEAKSATATTFESFTADDALALVADFQGITTGNASLSGSIDMLMAEAASMPSFDMMYDDILVAAK